MATPGVHSIPHPGDPPLLPALQPTGLCASLERPIKPAPGGTGGVRAPDPEEPSATALRVGSSRCAQSGVGESLSMRSVESRRGCLCLAFLLLNLLGQVPGTEQCDSLCPASCPERIECAPGVPEIWDRCGCCLVCARQLGENCSDLAPCQKNADLFCDRRADPTKRTGVCKVEEGSCVFAGINYESGVTFQPSCQVQCTCQNRHVTCHSLCDENGPTPGPDCPVPRKVQVPGECCEKWVCHSNDTLTLPEDMSEDNSSTQVEIITDTTYNCIEQTTEWTACSKSCGEGVSMRVTNNNEQCQMVKQVRYCMVRPCGTGFKIPKFKKGKRCHRAVRSPEPINLQFGNCTSMETYRPRFCGICIDGRCCTPETTETMFVDFKCRSNKIVQKPVMLIEECSCHTNCPQDYILPWKLKPNTPWGRV